MNRRKIDSDKKKMMKIDYSKVKKVNTMEEMMKSVYVAHAKLIDKRLDIVLKAWLNKEDYQKAKSLIKTRQKEVIGLFLIEHQVQIKMTQVPSDNNPFNNHIYFDVIFYPESNSPTMVRLSFISEEEFRKQLKVLKDLKKTLVNEQL